MTQESHTPPPSPGDLSAEGPAHEAAIEHAREICALAAADRDRAAADRRAAAAELERAQTVTRRFGEDLALAVASQPDDK